jgi:hypothetical protein
LTSPYSSVGREVDCWDGVCEIVSVIDVAADRLHVPGSNVTIVVTMPISVGCKTFVGCYKLAKLP